MNRGAVVAVVGLFHLQRLRPPNTLSAMNLVGSRTEPSCRLAKMHPPITHLSESTEIKNNAAGYCPCQRLVARTESKNQGCAPMVVYCYDKGMERKLFTFQMAVIRALRHLVSIF